MFSDDSIRNDVTLLSVVVEEIQRRIRDLPVGTGGGGVDTNTLQRITGLEQAVTSKVDTSSLVNLAPATGSTVYATQAQLASKANTNDVTTALAAKANVTDVAVALSSKADTGHTHTGVYATVADTYTKSQVDSVFATKAEIPDISGGLTTTQGDQRYVLETDLFEKVTDIGDQAYAPVTGSSVYALKTEIPDISGKANVSDVTNAMANKADAIHTHTGVYAPIAGSTNYASTDHTHDGLYATTDHNHDVTYQTKADMLVVGAETQYPSKAYADTLYAPISSGSSATPSLLHITNPNRVVHNPPAVLSAGGMHGLFSWQIRTNNTALTAFWKPIATGTGWNTTGEGTIDGVFSAFQNRTSNTYRLKVWFDLGSTQMMNAVGYGTTNDTRTWIQWMKNVPVDALIINKMASIVFDPPYGVSGTQAVYSPGAVVYEQVHEAYGMQFTRHLGPRHMGTATFLMGPGDLFLVKYFTHCGTTLDGKLYSQVLTGGMGVPADSTWAVKTDGIVNELYAEVTKV